MLSYRLFAAVLAHPIEGRSPDTTRVHRGTAAWTPDCRHDEIMGRNAVPGDESVLPSAPNYSYRRDMDCFASWRTRH